jgi:hypothetical protein
MLRFVALCCAGGNQEHTKSDEQSQGAHRCSFPHADTRLTQHGRFCCLTGAVLAHVRLLCSPAACLSACQLNHAADPPAPLHGCSSFAHMDPADPPVVGDRPVDAELIQWVAARLQLTCFRSSLCCCCAEPAVRLCRRAKDFYADAPRVLAEDADLQLRATTAGGWALQVQRQARR